jgi:delta-1-pyrroline-5-carboxylate synthetase
MDSKIVPILNTNDAIAQPAELTQDKEGALNINDNDSLAAQLATMVDSDLLLIMSDIDGVYDKHPSEADAHLISTFAPKTETVSFGEKSNVGTGGMESKIKAAAFAIDNNCSVIICNGKKQNAIVDSVKGKKVGTFFTNDTDHKNSSVEALAMNGTSLSLCLFEYFFSTTAIKTFHYLNNVSARNGGRIMQTLSAEKRSKIIRDYAQSLLKNTKEIMEANMMDIELAKKNSQSTCGIQWWCIVLKFRIINGNSRFCLENYF